MLKELLLHLQSAVILIGLFLSFFFFSNRSSGQNYWLGVITCLLSLHFANLILIDKFQVPHLGLVFGLFYGPIIYGFVKSHFESHLKNRLIHFTPGILLLLWILFYDLNRGITPYSEIYITSIFVFIHLFIYLKLSHDFYKKYKLLLKQTRSKAENSKIEMVRRIIIGIMILVSLSVLDTLSGIWTRYDVQVLFSLLITVTLIFGMLNIIFDMMTGSAVFIPFSKEEELLVRNDIQYASSGLTEEQAILFSDKLLNHLNEEKSFRDPELTIRKLSRKTEIPVRDLSRVINQTLKQNFFELINGYRIREAQEQLCDPSKRISEIMYNVGFSSRSSFNTAFKRRTGLTPSQFRKEKS